jgi:hypothetical protein
MNNEFSKSETGAARGYGMNLNTVRKRIPVGFAEKKLWAFVSRRAAFLSRFGGITFLAT